MKYPQTLENLISCYKKLPGVGEKTAERMAFSTLKMDEETVQLFSDSLKDVKTKIKKCIICNNITEEEKCSICKDESRIQTTICILEDAKKVQMIEKLKVYNGLYHIIEEPVTPFISSDTIDRNINPLIKRITDNNVEEIIFALKLTIEGETTAAYISKLLEKEEVKITKIAQGIPHGADIDYIDSLTLEKAIEDRKVIWGR